MMISRRTRALLKLSTQRIGEVLGLIVRIGLCLAVGFIVLITSYSNNYDFRFALRGPQNVGTDVVLINLQRSDITWMSDLKDPRANNIMWSLKEIVETSDSFFWRPIYWEQVLSKLEAVNPKAILITLFFSDDVVKRSIT